MLNRMWAAITVAFRSLTGKAPSGAVLAVDTPEEMRALSDSDLDTYITGLKSEVGARYDAGDPEFERYFWQAHEAARERDRRKG